MIEMAKNFKLSVDKHDNEEKLKVIPEELTSKEFGNKIQMHC